MGIAITDEHRDLEAVTKAFFENNGALAASRALLNDPTATLPSFWPALSDLGWLGLHIGSEHGGSGYGLAETAIVAQAVGACVAPGPYTTTAIVGAIVQRCASSEIAASLLGDMVSGAVPWAFGFGDPDLTVDSQGENAQATGASGVVLAGAMASRAAVIAGDDVILIDLAALGVTVTTPTNVDPSRPSIIAQLNAVPVTVLANAARVGRAIAWTLLAAECAGLARTCCENATAYAKERTQFGRVIGSFQAIKHHCANMAVAAEMATAAAWDAARAGDGDSEDEFVLAAANAAVLAIPAAYDNAQMNTQVHGGIAFTWEHDAHLFTRRAVALRAVATATSPHVEVIDAKRNGVSRSSDLELPPEAEAIRERVRTDLAAIVALPEDQRTNALVDSGYGVPHWPTPFGRGAGPVEQLVIESEMHAAGLHAPQYGITSWVILTLIQHGTPDQIERWIAPALHYDTVWCQMFSEPGSGSDAASIQTRGVRVDGGWLLNGQKVWTSVAHQADLGLVTIRTDPDAAKHDGITTMVIDMHAEGVEVRPLRQVTGQSDFNEVFLTDVFVPDDDVVGPINGGWKVARSTFGNERVGIGGGVGSGFSGFIDPVALLDAHPDRAASVIEDVAGQLSRDHTLRLLNIRRAQRAVAGTEAGPEGNVTKLVVAEQGMHLADIALRLVGPDAAFLEGEGAATAFTTLAFRGMTIAGGTSEITRNQIAERILGLPRDPLLK